MIILASVMVLSLASCSAKTDSSAEASTKTAVPEQTAPQETEPEADVSQEAKPEAAGSLEANSESASSQEANSEAKVSQEPEVDPVVSMFNGLWMTNSSIGTLYYFDNGTVTCYINDNYDPSAPDLHYEIAQKESYTVEQVISQEASGYRAVLKSGNQYWLLDDYPDVLSCYWYDENGVLQLSGSSSLMRVTDYTVDDLIVEGVPEDQNIPAEAVTDNAKVPQSPYAAIVRRYENDYKKLTFLNVDGFDYYIGVFEAKLIDFDQDGSDELLIGYSTPREDVEQYIPQPKLDVWTMKNGAPVQVYEGANVGHGDIGSHCALIDFDGKYCLCTGYNGYEMDLTLLSLEKGSFTEYLNLKSDMDGSYYKINGEDASEDQWKELYQKIDDDPEEHFHSGYLTQSGHESREALQEAVSEDYKLLGM